ncbi:MAG TPA: hypothetical protein VI078_00700 [bacterium]
MPRLTLSALMAGLVLLTVSPGLSRAANMYVDPTIAQNITTGTYSVINRNSTGSNGNAYRTIKEAIAAMNGGDDIYIRGGTYREGYIEIPTSKNGTAGDWSSIQSYPGEWAILDGERAAQYGVVLGNYGYGDSAQLKYWRLERLELTGGGTRSGNATSTCAGFWGNGGPFHIRQCYIHDNLSYTYINNPSGLTGAEWKDSVVEYCFFRNNGSDGLLSGNCAHIAIYSDYLHDTNAQYGYDGVRGTRNNAFRYNYFEDGYVGIKHKSGQLLSGRNAGAGHGWNDNYVGQGDKIHHNIFRNLGKTAMYISQDFAQIYNNIVDTRGLPITVQYEPSRYVLYKVGTYNNTILNPAGAAITRYGKQYWAFEEAQYYGFDFNNLIVGGNSSAPYGQERIINVVPDSSGVVQFGFSNYSDSHNYFYRPISAYLFRYFRTDFDAVGAGAQTLTRAPRVVYTNTGGGGLNIAYENGYFTDGDHVLGTGVTLKTGGIGGVHPYLPDVRLPGYVGAIDPSDSRWVRQVLDLSQVQNLMNPGYLGIGAPSNLRIQVGNPIP